MWSSCSGIVVLLQTASFIRKSGEKVGLGVPNCELFVGRSRYEETGLVEFSVKGNRP